MSTSGSSILSTLEPYAILFYLLHNLGEWLWKRRGGRSSRNTKQRSKAVERPEAEAEATTRGHKKTATDSLLKRASAEPEAESERNEYTSAKTLLLRHKHSTEDSGLGSGESGTISPLDHSPRGPNRVTLNSTLDSPNHISKIETKL